LPTRRTALVGLILGLLVWSSPAWATQGTADTAMILSIVFFALPAFFTTLGLTIASIVRLASRRPPRLGQGRVAFGISLACLVPSIPISLTCMAYSGWFDQMVTTMLGVFIPIFLLSLASTLLAWRIRRKGYSSPGCSRR